MSTLLQRLAGQAIGATAPRVRAAERTRAQVPIVMPVPAPSRGIGIPPVSEHTGDRQRPSHRPDHAVSEPPPQKWPPAGLDHNSRDRAPRPLDHHAPAFKSAERATPSLVTAPSVTVTEITHSVTAAAGVPAPLLKEVAHVAPVSGTDGSIQPAKPAAVSAISAEPAEVHVHIGRIEVTAVQSPAPPARKRETPRRSVALSDYLARRRSS